MPTETHTGPDLSSPGVSNRIVVIAAAAMMLIMLIGVGLLLGIYIRQVPVRTLPSPQSLPEPQVRVDERLLRKRLEAEQVARLSGYRWENDQKTIIGIPIERAMQILAARGANAYDPVVQPGSTAMEPGPAAASASQSSEFRVPSDKEPRPAEKGVR
jgi:hypothetical protein